MLKIENVNKYYTKDGKKLPVLDSINFDVSKNEFLCIVGPSGCGKTTLLKIIIGLIKSSSGEIIYKKSKSFFSFVFQEHNLLPWKTVFQNIAFPLEIQKKDKKLINKTVRNLIKLVGLERFENYYPHQISEGMKQRVGIARALSINPKILLMDEPFSQLDAITREKLQKSLVKIISKTKKTVIFITHNIDEALFLGDRIIVLNGKPSKIKGIIKVNMRKKDASEFFDYKNKIKKLIENEK